MDLRKSLLALFQAKKNEAEEEQSILEQGAVAEALVRHSGWNLLLDWFAAEDEKALNELGKINLDDPWACQAGLIKFRRTRALMVELQDHIHGIIGQKKQIEEARKEEKESYTDARQLEESV